MGHVTTSRLTPSGIRLGWPNEGYQTLPTRDRWCVALRQNTPTHKQWHYPKAGMVMSDGMPTALPYTPVLRSTQKRMKRSKVRVVAWKRVHNEIINEKNSHKHEYQKPISSLLDLVTSGKLYSLLWIIRILHQMNPCEKERKNPQNDSSHKISP